MCPAPASGDAGAVVALRCRPGRRRVGRLEYRKCAGDAAVVLYTIQDGGHTWPGGKALPQWRVGANSTSIDATRRMWAFSISIL
jgi:poly(3-hydroxybutyrate) depolymerase